MALIYARTAPADITAGAETVLRPPGIFRDAPFYALSVLLPVVPDVLHVLVVLQHINELLHILQVALIREGDVVLGLLLQWFQQFFSSPELRFFAHEPKL